MKIGDPGFCYFCGDESVRAPSSSLFDIALECCDRCGECADGLLRLLERRLPDAPDVSSTDSEERALEYDRAAEEFEERARDALEDILGVPSGDKVLVLAVRAITSAATAETCARLVRLGKI
jgi:hypothetical protein